MQRYAPEQERKLNGEGTEAEGHKAGAKIPGIPHLRIGRARETFLLHFSLALGNLCIARKTSQTFPGRPLRQCLLRSDVGITRGGYYVTATDGGQEVKVFSFRNRASPSVKPRSNCTVG